MAADESMSTGQRSDPLRACLLHQIRDITPWDAQESAHAAWAMNWISSEAPLHRTRKPDVPEPHLVSYFVALNSREEVLLVAHRKAGLWLPSGGHVEPGETPWAAVVRECQEELHIPAVPSPLAGDRPFFITVTRTRGEGSHTDVSLWYVLDIETISSYDREEFAGIKWLTLPQVLDEPIEILDPHMHRFTRKLIAALAP
ncbi:NUDIX domain-containing protein [Planobispora longispora]|uniref:DNA mismatch repair protein MutT n=1 Tax=Planobispora longispora TaxID=28887 RepID=A0A8J3RHY7_9ACTN|nr:NUDIX hydrolase [Planobispora longispora]GIH76057.1 DNA mismatch repair protein MutT [Planobispora longispora]